MAASASAPALRAANFRRSGRIKKIGNWPSDPSACSATCSSHDGRIEKMSQRKPITIIGGGLAGLTLGIGLRQRGVSVTIWEAGRYPRHRVCGEFISGNGQAVLERLGLLARFEQAGAVHARTVMFVCGTNRSPVRQLAAPALCLSRLAMDALLAESFQQLGGELLVNTRWTSGEFREGVVQAAGQIGRAHV